MPLDLSGLSPPALLGIFAAAVLLVWTAGTRLVRLVDAIAEQTGLGKAFVGMLFLGGITSLPEVAAVSTSAAIGNAPLAVNNLLGTASVNLILLAVADFIYGRRALTAAAATPSALMQGVLSMLLATIVAIFAAVGDVPLWGFGLGSATLVVAAAAAIWIASGFESRHVWEAVREEEAKESPAGPLPNGNPIVRSEREWPLRKLIVATCIVAAAILVGGVLLSTTADALAVQTGIQAGMVGFLLVGIATSLPEISSITAAIRLREYEMAVGDIFGTNLFNFSLIFLADVIYAGEPLLSAVGTFEVFGALLASLLTGIFLVGLLERRPVTVLRFGTDSIIASTVFALGLVVLSRIGG